MKDHIPTATPIGAPPPHSVFLTERETAELLKISTRSLQRWRQEGGNIRFRRFGGRVRYALSDVLSWAEAQATFSTAERGA